MTVVEALVVAALLGAALYVLLGRRAGQPQLPEWSVVTHTREDGTLVVALRGPEGGERVVRELPPGLTGHELTSELRLAREEAADQAAELNRGPA